MRKCTSCIIKGSKNPKQAQANKFICVSCEAKLSKIVACVLCKKNPPLGGYPYCIICIKKFNLSVELQKNENICDDKPDPEGDIIC